MNEAIWLLNFFFQAFLTIFLFSTTTLFAICDYCVDCYLFELDEYGIVDGAKGALIWGTLLTLVVGAGRFIAVVLRQ